MIEIYPHTPGSDQAIADKCLCPVLDNAHGRGCVYVGENGEHLFMVDEECPLHGSAEFFPEDTQFRRDISGPAYGAASRMKDKRA